MQEATAAEPPPPGHQPEAGGGVAPADAAAPAHDDAGAKCRGALRAWAPFRSTIYSEDVKALLGSSAELPKGTQLSLRMRYELHSEEFQPSLDEDAVPIVISVHDKGKCERGDPCSPGS